MDDTFFNSLGKKGYIGFIKKGSTFPSYPPEKTYTMMIPIPTNKETNWGVREKDFVYRPPGVYDLVDDKVEGIDFSNFNSLSDYIVECSKRGIEQLLMKGISLKGIKIKVQTR